MENKVEDLRNHLFAQLDRLSDEETFKNPIAQEREIKRTAAIIQVATALIDSARAETEFIKVMGTEPEVGFPTFFDPSEAPKEIKKKTEKKLNEPNDNKQPISTALKFVDADKLKKQTLCSHTYGFDYENVEKGLKRTCKKCSKSFIEAKSFTEDDAVQKSIGIMEKESEQ